MAHHSNRGQYCGKESEIFELQGGYWLSLRQEFYDHFRKEERTRLLPDPPGPQYITDPTTNTDALESSLKCSMNYSTCPYSTLFVAAPWGKRDGREPT